MLYPQDYVSSCQAWWYLHRLSFVVVCPSFCIMSICYFSIFPLWFRELDFGSNYTITLCFLLLRSFRVG